jgi:hypothetical protein
LTLAGAAFSQRIDQSQNVVEAAVPANGFRGGRMQWLNAISEFFTRGIRPHRILSAGEILKQDILVRVRTPIANRSWRQNF